MQTDTDEGRGLSYTRNSRQGFVEEHDSQSPPIKSEPHWNVPTPTSSVSSSFAAANTKNVSSTAPVNGAMEVNFGTEVDTLMKAIQAKSQNTTPQTPSTEQSRTVVGASLTHPHTQTSSQSTCYISKEASTFKLTRSEHQEESASSKSGKKRYHCTIENCEKSFYQKTHLDIHERAHTGVKPYPCKEPGCGRSFSQLGNLKTHERRHTGERPYQCETCGKRFAQRGNVRAHRIVHNQEKPYLCRLDDCGKQFTQLGNLKSHQNKFHTATIRSLTTKFASIKDGDIVHAADKELWEYFANLYKNSNKGIKGRGKDRKVGSNSMAMTSSMRSMGVGGNGGYSISGSGRGNMIVGVMNNGLIGAHQPNRQDSRYEIFDVDDESQSGHSGSGGASSVGTCYDDAPSDGFEDTGRGGDLAFGDRIY
ncbi:putative asparagine-rich zinc finger protein AZF1 [Halenospora varia]|nr:putative asparagine-rich zinc finger protein AZF1 [Halenospora varia]